ncbi:MAG: Gmad2 immunoglobulin-like domain-containing protein [bacterium]|nr:Gmad2 immunoglobulin-like domain-containing protein [bacterium]MDZ4299670.1 Gmad2 immunoglobulin-like domain-containing protein [Candidatus Sungbacteria bacterium]
MKIKLAIAITSVLAVVAGLGGWFILSCTDDWCFVFQWQKIRAADSFARCAGLGFPVAESYPRQCRAGEKSFTETVQPPEVIQPTENDIIRVSSPLPDTVVASPLIVKGEARGTWYFEASFPVKIFDANGKQLGIIPAQAQKEWMTTEFVPFEATLIFENATTKTGTIVLEKDNPSGLPEYADSLSIPIRFSVQPQTTKTGTLEGVMTIGPICPVERIDRPCTPSPETFAIRKVFVYKPDKKTLVVTLTPDAEGKFSATLPEGDYWIDMAHPGVGVGGISGVPILVHIKTNSSVTLMIDVDTGIR